MCENDAGERGDCPICLSDLGEGESARMPGCRHEFHVHCLLNVVQYDTRCPVCRQVGEGVLQRSSDLVLSATAFFEDESMVTFEERHAQVMREWRRYAAKRRRVLRQHPHLKHQYDTLKDLRSNMKHSEASLQNMFDVKCKEVWTKDMHILERRRALQNMRRRELRIARNLSVCLEELIGPEP